MEGSAYYLLLTAFFLAISQSIISLTDHYFHCALGPQCLKSLIWGQFILVSGAFFSLAFSFLINDFSLFYVAQNSNSHLPWFYRVCAVWGGHEGSILLWIFILNLWMVSLLLWGQALEVVMLSRILAVLSFINAGFLSFLLWVSSPFTLTKKIPIDGQDLNPLLQDPGLIVHPPLLYIGYVGFSVAFAFSVVGLLNRRFDKVWASSLRPWVQAAWVFLTLGIASGSWWAYRVLGWGGWWFWDPVENASLLPWLAGTALIHSLLVVIKQERLKAWVLFLSLLSFALSLIGTFIVRSGILISVHAFAMDPLRGIFLLGLLSFFIGPAFFIYAIQIHHFKPSSIQGPIILLSRAPLLVFNNILLSVSIFTILLATLYPSLIEVLGLGKISVGAPYFNTVFTPLAAILLFSMGVSYCSTWDQISPHVITKIIRSFGISLFISVVLISFFAYRIQWKATVGTALTLWIFLNTGQLLGKISKESGRSFNKIIKERGSMTLAHLGVAISSVGIILSSSYSRECEVRMAVGDNMKLGSYHLGLKQVHALQGPNYTGIEALIQMKKEALSRNLYPQLRYYPVSDVTLSKPAIQTNFWRDLYIVLAEPYGNRTWVFRFYYKPFIRWIWTGSICMVLGGVWALFNKQRTKK